MSNTESITIEANEHLLEQLMNMIEATTPYCNAVLDAWNNLKIGHYPLHVISISDSKEFIKQQLNKINDAKKAADMTVAQLRELQNPKLPNGAIEFENAVNELATYLHNAYVNSIIMRGIELIQIFQVVDSKLKVDQNRIDAYKNRIAVTLNGSKQINLYNQIKKLCDTANELNASVYYSSIGNISLIISDCPGIKYNTRFNKAIPDGQWIKNIIAQRG